MFLVCETLGCAKVHLAHLIVPPMIATSLVMRSGFITSSRFWREHRWSNNTLHPHKWMLRTLQSAGMVFGCTKQFSFSVSGPWVNSEYRPLLQKSVALEGSYPGKIPCLPQTERDSSQWQCMSPCSQHLCI